MRAALLALVVAGLGGCYHPKIDDGALRCGAAGLCPDGYTCSEMVCVKKNGNLDLGGGGTLFSGAAGPLDLSMVQGTVQCSTKTGEIKLNGGSSIIPPFADMVSGFQIVPQSSGPPVAIWSFSSIIIPTGVTLKATSDSNDTLPLFASSGDITVDGGIDWRGFGGVAGSAGMTGKDIGGAMTGGTGGTGDGGGGGGGHADIGGTGAGSSGGVGGAAYGVPELNPVFAGSGGGGGGNVGGQGGNGGGALILVSAATLSVSGKLDVSGNAGSMASAAGGGGGGGGGGSGGSILLSAATVSLNPGHELVALGGKGGAGTGTGAAGGDGSSGRIWIGGNISAAGGIVSTPTATSAVTPITTFPQPAM